MIGMRRLLKRIWIPIILRLWPLARLWYRLWGLTLEGKPSDDVWYFAFGANLNDSVFRGHRKMRPLEWRVGKVDGYRLRFNLEGRPKGKAAPANIEPHYGEEVWGVLYRMTRRDMVWLNSTEGVPGPAVNGGLSLSLAALGVFAKENCGKSIAATNWTSTKKTISAS